MRVSIITVTYNAKTFIEDCVESVLGQSFDDIEYIVIDGGSDDGTQAIIQSYGHGIAHFVSEPDEGIYDAMNKGVALASGDIIGLLNADDFYAHPHVLEEVVKAFQAYPVDIVFGDLVYVTPEDKHKIVRYYPGSNFHPKQMRQGQMPPHPTVFARARLFEAYGHFDTSFKICADFDWLLRMLVNQQVPYHYIPDVLVHMRTGGASTRNLKSTLTINQEMLRSCRQNGVNTSLPRIYSKYFTKVFQLIKRPV